jgi:uncharacterized membrane protein
VHVPCELLVGPRRAEVDRADRCDDRHHEQRDPVDVEVGAQLHGALGNDGFGRLAEQAARFFGTPQHILGQTVAVLAWVALNSTQIHLGFAWDVYPFIALNLLFSLQAHYAAPLILLAQTRQADRDKLHSVHVEKSHTRLERAGEGRNLSSSSYSSRTPISEEVCAAETQPNRETNSS